MGAIICAYESDGSNQTPKIEIMKLATGKLQSRDKPMNISSDWPAADLPPEVDRVLTWMDDMLEGPLLSPGSMSLQLKMPIEGFVWCCTLVLETNLLEP